MKRLILGLALVLLASPARAGDAKFYAYDGADRLTRSLTSGITLEIEKGLFGAVRLVELFSTTARGSAELSGGGPGDVLRALPEGARETVMYAIAPEGQGRGLTRALCPGSNQAWLVTARIRPGRPLTMQAVGLWEDGRYRHCATLSYVWRGEWAPPPGRDLQPREGAGAPITR